jgi:hypothetical protein
MARASYFVRFCAIAAMLHVAGDLKLAVPLFEKYCPSHELREDVNEFLERWWQRFQGRQDGEDFLYEAARVGRPRNVTEADRKTAAEEFAKGCYNNGKWKAFGSLKEVRS